MEVDLDAQRLAALRTCCQMNYEMAQHDPVQLRTEKLELAALSLTTNKLNARDEWRWDGGPTWYYASWYWETPLYLALLPATSGIQTIP